MAKGKLIIIGLLGAAVIAVAAAFFVLLSRRGTVAKENPSGRLPPAPMFSFPGSPSGSAKLGIAAEPGIPANAFAPAKEAPTAQVSGGVFSPPSQPSGIGADITALSQLGSKLGLRDMNGNPLTPQQIEESSNLPAPLQKLMQTPGGPTLEDIFRVDQEVQTQYNVIDAEAKQLQSSSSQSPLSSSTIAQCNQFMADFKNFVNTWGGGSASSSVLQQATGCTNQLPFGFPAL